MGGMIFWREYPVDKRCEMDLHQFEFGCQELILGQRHEELNRGRRALPAGLAVTLVPLARHGNLCQYPSNAVVQVAHWRLLLRGGGEGMSGNASIAAIASSAAARRATDRSTAGVLPFPGLRSLPLLRFLRMLDFPSSNVVQRRQSAAVCCRGVKPVGKCYCSLESAVAARVDICERRRTPLRLCGCCAARPAPHALSWRRHERSPGSIHSRESLTQDSRSAVKARSSDPSPWITRREALHLPIC